MEDNRILTQKREELAALKTKLQQLPKIGVIVNIGMAFTFLGVVLMLFGYSGVGFLAILVGVVTWNFGRSSDLKRKKAFTELGDQMLKVTLEIGELEHR